jgi:hypothetical protein
VSNERETASSDPLDEWLDQARWPEASPESVARLRAAWLAVRGRNRWSWLAPLSAAAVVALAIGLAWLMQQKPVVPRSLVVHTENVDPPARPAVLPGRPPTVLETMMIRAAEDREKKGKSTTRPVTIAQSRPNQTAPSMPPPAPSAPKVPSDPIVALLNDNASDAAIQRYLDLVQDSSTRAKALAALARVAKPPTERMLASLDDPRADRRLAAALVLGRIDGPVLTRRLIDMVAADQNRREAFIALASSRGADARAFVRQATQSPALSGLAQSTLAMNEVRQTEVQ